MLLPTKARRFPSSARSLPVHAVALVAVLGAAPPVTAAAQSGAATTTAVPLGGLFSTSVPTARGAIGFRFVNVTQAGTLTVSAVAQHPLGAPVVTLWLPLTVTVSTTATFDEVRICVPYAPSEIPAGLVPARLNLWRSEAGSPWYPRERADDGSVPEVCGTVGAAALAVIGIGGLPVDVEQWVPSGGSQALQTSRGVVTLNLSGWTGGWLTVGASSSDPAQYGSAPIGLRFVPALMFMLTTTDSLSWSELCFPYATAGLGAAGIDPARLRLFNHQTHRLFKYLDHHLVSGWTDITTRLDTSMKQVCGRVPHADIGRAFAFGGPGVSTPHFLAEGATSTMFDTQIAVLNPHYTPTVAALSFLKSDGTTTTVQRTIPARTRVTVTPKVDAGLNPAEFSTRVDADRELVVDRTIAWDAATGYGAHAEAAVVAPSPMWYLAEGATSDTLNLFYLLQNPNATAVPVRVRYLRPSGSPLEKTYQLAPTSRTNIWVNVETFPGLGTALARTDVSAVIDTLDGQSIIVERALYLDRPGQIFAAGHESAGVTAPALQWFLAEGATGSFFDLFVLIANPGPTDAAIEATYLLPDGTTITKPYTVAANSRFNIWVDFEDTRLADTAVSTTIRSTNGVAVIVERALWWPSGGWYEAHNSPGSTVTGTAWAVAEGEVGGPRQMSTYLLVANTSAKAATVRVTLLYEGGDIPDDPYGTTARTFNVLPNSRFNVDVDAEFPWARGRRFGAIVESEGTDPAQIVVERAMYWDAEGRSWAAGTNALATRMACISPLPGLVCDGDPVIDSCGRDQGVVGKRKGCCSNICDVAEDCTAYGVPENWACTSRSAHCGEPKVACMKDASGCKQCAIVGWCPGCYDVLRPSSVVVKPDWLK